MTDSPYDLMRTQIQAGAYEPTVRYEHDKKGWRRQRDGARGMFRDDLAEAYGVKDNPKSGRLFEIAWEYGHSNGMTEVLMHYDDMVDLIR